MKTVFLPPDAEMLLESMRAIGYEPASATADLIDNSITANARHVSIRFDPGVPRAVGILDDGDGISSDRLAAAMRHGSQSPANLRAANDLGRFGLGLKTASMSQCRQVTVVSLQRGGKPHGMMWDLDRVKNWSAWELEPEELNEVPFLREFLKNQNGTLVVWQKLDRLADGDPGDGSILSERMAHVAEHLSLVFHRFLSGKPVRLRLDMNKEPITPVDPFLEDEGSLSGEEETIHVDRQKIVLRAFTLPHISRLSRAQILKAGGELGLRRQQGFYIYRNHRLIIWGTWFKMFHQEELTKSTRVRVDVPNALDQMWSLDIKKSTASPPPAIRDRLRGLVPTLVNPSRESNRYRGRLTKQKGICTIWQRIEDRDGIRYEIDNKHPIVAGLRLGLEDGMLGELDNVLRAISESLPVEALYNDRANDKMGHKDERAKNENAAAELEELALQMLDAFVDQAEERERLIDKLDAIEPFAFHPELIKKLQTRLRKI